MNAEILHQDIQTLLEFFAKNCYRASDSNSESSFGNDVMQKCSVLMKLDYSVVEISNATGELSTHYPSTVLIPEYENHSFTQQQPNSVYNGLTSQQQPTNRQQTIYESTYEAGKLRDLINKARFARCRARFPLPVILYRGKYICRSATLSGGPEIYTRSGFDYLFAGVDNTTSVKSSPLDEEAYEAQETSLNEEACTEEKAEKGSSEWQLFDRVRNQDIKLLRTLNVGSIIDLMVEKKKVKFMMNVTSSEKVDKEKRYQDFKLISLPYPGCEFFRLFRDNNYSGEGLLFDWSQKNVDAEICVPEDPMSAQLNINWDSYKGWDLVQITQNYIKLLLKYLQDSSSGLLIHCISGWDRTPLFISLLRLSLWADGAIHQSLSAIQILYFTIAYDWLLCGHRLVDRLEKGEEIFFFCFYALKYLMDDEFSVVGQRFRSKQSSSGSSSIGVIRTDSDVFEGILFDGDSRGSSVSLNSTCSARSHQDSHSNIISSNGLIDDTNVNLNGTSPMLVPQSEANSSIGGHHRQRQESSSSISRLNAVRTLFYNCYSSTIGYKFKNGTDSATLGSLLGNFAERVGLTQRTTV
ncbi:CLUMA_CG017142, isoform B [Clunio marinus]|uniref:CLUMA_CG017142, isoform B n=1 Tax=Clunio marinus TaxID=568069 RepID=A0A1J1IZL7_9DIPT|nr:CLUMA_CG017142, isoform B [Clunio marinus]